MNKIKPYLFWVIAAVILVLLMVGSFVFAPTGDVNGEQQDAVGVKTALDRESKKFKELTTRAKKGDPRRVFDPVIDNDIKELTNDYLLTPKWDEQIRPNVTQYGLQLQAIRADLVARSAVLHEKITDKEDRLAWFTAYQEQTGKFVAQLRDAKCLVVPTVGGSGGPTGFNGGQPGFAGGALAPAAGQDDPLDPATGSKIRDIVGLFTRTGDLPVADQHPLLTTRFRIVQAIGRLVLASGVEARANPIVAESKVVTQPAAITGITWGQDTEPLTGTTAMYATYIRLKLNLQGTESSLMAALAGLESLSQPVAIVVSSTFSRQEKLSAGARKVTTGANEAYAPSALLEVDLLVLDYSKMPDPTSAELAVQQQPGAGMPGMPGMPGAGMMPNFGGGPGMMPDFGGAAPNQMPSFEDMGDN